MRHAPVEFVGISQTANCFTISPVASVPYYAMLICCILVHSCMFSKFGMLRHRFSQKLKTPCFIKKLMATGSFTFFVFDVVVKGVAIGGKWGLKKAYDVDFFLEKVF